MASEVSICNVGMKLLGAKRISAFPPTDTSPNATRCNDHYEQVRDAELRKHAWNFAITRVALAPDAEAPAFGETYKFLLPTDCIRPLIPKHDTQNGDNDWTLEGRHIVTSDANVVYLRYIKQITDPNLMDALFRDAVSAKLAYLLCEDITGSTTKQSAANDAYDMAITEAKKINAFEKQSQSPPPDSWVTAGH